ncbi:MAG: carboxypeptidase regulatory-like domain-containing protein [Nitrospirae bacterium]|nr:carboxypeptidase regulatory-like domain-containing protein [Nitrospirota bacterium]MCL5420983.1 carboxypeptidase regulatory-like domain-containing protein [Nitrospirota bacterium]
MDKLLRSSIITFIFLLLLSQPLFALDDLLDAPGIDPNRETISSMPDEHIDPFTGGLTLSHVDARLLGNGGLDLVIQRSFSSKNMCNEYTYFTNWYCSNRGEKTWMGYGWKLHFGQAFIKVTNINDIQTIEMPDGSRHAAYKRDGSMTKYITKDYWLLDWTGSTWVLTLTNGTKLYLGQASSHLNSRYINHTLYLVSKIEDANGNTINIYYKNDPAIAGFMIPNYIIDSVGRRIDFYYSTVNGGTYLTRISGPGIDIDYAYDPITGLYGAALLKSVTFPLGPPWEYTYDETLMDLLTVKTTSGGILSYTYDFSSVNSCGWNFTYRTVKQKQNSGRDIPTGTWSFAYSQGTNSEYTQITDPCGRTIKYGFYGYGSTLNTGEKWKYGLPKSKEIIGEETITYSWTNSPYISTDDYLIPYCGRDYDIFVPLIASQAITRDGRTYTTNYSNYDSYGNPQYISETGDKTRNKSVSYWYNTSRNIVQNKPSTESVSGGFPGTFATNYYYDTDGNLTQVNKYGVVTNYSYDTYGNLYSTTDANSNTTYYQWSNGKISRITNPIYSISRTINSNGTVASETNGRGYTTYFTYDSNLRLTDITPPTGSNPTSFTYATDNSYKRESRGGYYIDYYSDGFGRPSGTTDSKGVTTDIVYKNCGLKNYSTSNIGDTSYYDNFGRVNRVLHKDSTDVIYTYSGSTATISNEARNNTTLTYNAFGNPDEKLLVTIVDALNNTTTYSYNMLGSLTAAVQGSISRTFSLNSKNFLDSESHPENGTITYGRDNVGNMTSKTDAMGTKSYTYDSLNRLTQISYGAGNIVLTYDNANNRTSMDNPSAAIDYTYDAANRLTRKTQIIAGRTYTTDYDYDGNDNITNLYYPSGRRVYHSYNSNNQVMGLDYFGARVGGVTYNTAGLPTGYTFYPSGKSTNFTYNTRNLMTRSNAGSANDVGYGYDSRENTISMTNYTDRSKDQTFLYDSLNRLTGFDGAWGAGSYAYNATGNRSSKTVAGLTTTYSYSSNRLSSTTGGEPATFTYNGYGSPTAITWQGNSYTLSYDALNNLTNYNLGAAVLGNYSYDGDGMRVIKVANGKTTVYHYDKEGRVISENDSAGNFIADYIYLNGKLVAKVANDAFLPPDAPTNLSATAISSSQINLSWTDNSSNETGFKIERKTGIGGIYVEIATVGANVTTFSNTGLTPDTTYFYRVRAYNAGGDSAYSNEDNVTTATTPPAAPTNLGATAVSSSQINLSWTDNSNNETGFKIERKTGVGGVYSQIGTVGASMTTYSDTGLAANTTYYYKVRAYNAGGDSSYSNEANATTLAPPPQPNITVSPTSHDFGNIVTGSSSAARTFTVQNTGDLNLLIGTLSITGANPAEFSKTSDNCSGQTLAPSSNCTVQIVFSPTTSGAKSANLSIPSNDPDTPTLSVLLTGTGVTQTYSISGTVSTPAGGTPGSPIAGVTMALSGTSTGTTTTDANGNYTFAGLSNGSYTITPSKAGYSFTPNNRAVAINGANITGQNFTGATVSATYSISGTVTDGVSPLSGVTMTLSGAGTGTTTTDVSGNYTFTGLANGTYTVTPSRTGYTFSPTSRTATISGADVTGQNFTGMPSATKYSISGTVTTGGGGGGGGGSSPLAGVTMTLSGAAPGTTTTDANGNYTFSGLSNGTYTLTPSMTGYTFTPVNRSVTISGANIIGQDFTRN